MIIFKELKILRIIQGYQFTYQKYLEEVVKILESDPKFNEKMRGMNEADIKVFFLLKLNLR